MAFTLPQLALLGQLGTTLPLVGLAWMVQVVAYPQFANVGPNEFATYHAAHARRITWVVAPLMLGELVASIAAVVAWDGAGPPSWALLGMALTASVWLVTAFVSVPYHNALANGFSESVHRGLVASNWLRTVAWTARGTLVLWLATRFSMSHS